MSILNPSYFIHAANILLLVAYSVRNVLWLRLLAVAAALLALPYYTMQPKPLWEPIAWSALFASINLFQSWRLVAERRPVKLTPEEDTIRKFAFRDLSPGKFVQLLNIGTWADLEIGQQMLKRGERAETVLVIARGEVTVTRGELVLGELVSGDIVGSALGLSGVPSEVDAMVTKPVRAMRWEVETLNRYLAANPDARIAVQRYLTRDLSRKLLHVIARSGNSSAV